ncbi:hypothetical protein NIES208_08750 [[Limnothrix rosea] IAM M-220]|nr:hypothetical protein NIES208_08750 [[Limnothrix rosea] IAM M-220]
MGQIIKVLRFSVSYFRRLLKVFEFRECMTVALGEKLQQNYKKTFSLALWCLGFSGENFQ